MSGSIERAQWADADWRWRRGGAPAMVENRPRTVIACMCTGEET